MIGLRRQPRGLIRINKANPIAKGLVCVFIGTSAFDPITGKRFVNVGKNRGYATNGTVLDAGVGQAKMTFTGPSLNTGSMFALATSFNATAEQVILEIGPDGAFVAGVRGIRFNGGKFGTYTRNFTSLDTPSSVYAYGVPMAVGATYAGTAGAIYVGGKQVNTGALAEMTSSASIFNVGGITGQTSYNLLGHVAVAFVWSRALQPIEMASISANPYQLFLDAAELEDDYIAAAASVTNGLASPLGVAASASTGSATVSAGARANPAGVIATASVGTASASAGTSATASPVGVSASASVGATTAAGGARVTPAGVTATGQVGQPSAFAGLGGNAAPVGVSASAQVGQVAVSAGALATPAGVGADAQVGTVTATGGSASVASPAGVTASASVGQASATGGASADAAGVTATAAVGQAVATAGGSGVAIPAGVGAAAGVGIAAGSGAAGCAPVGVTAFASVGAVIAAGSIAIPGTATPQGVTAYGRVGTAAAVGGGEYARAPAGSGYAPQRNEYQARPVQTGGARPPSIEKNYR